MLHYTFSIGMFVHLSFGPAVGARRIMFDIHVCLFILNLPPAVFYPSERSFAGFPAGILSIKRAPTVASLPFWRESQMWEFHLSCMTLHLSAALLPVMSYISLPHAAMTYLSRYSLRRLCLPFFWDDIFSFSGTIMTSSIYIPPF